MRAFAYARPLDLAEALALLAAHGPEARALAGGTDLMVGLRAGKVSPRVVVDIKRVRELRPRIVETGTDLTVSATTVLTDVIEEPCVRRHFPALVEASSTVGSVQIRNRATLAGNICNASPAADTVPALLVYGAEVLLAGAAGERRVALDDFFLGPGQTTLGQAELVAAVRLPKPGRGFGAAFGRLTRRRGVDLATISVCCGVDSSGVTRCGFGAVGPRPLLVTEPSGVLASGGGPDGPGGPRTDKQAWEQALAEVLAHTSPISDVRASREYRRAMLPVLTRRVLAVATERQAGRGP